MKKILFALGIILLALIGLVVYRTYPRTISLSLQGVEYKLGSPQQKVKPITLQLNGILVTSLLGKRKFDGTLNVLGSTIPNIGNGELTEIDFEPVIGGQIIYNDWKSQQPAQFFHFGVLYADGRFNEFTITEFQKEGKGFGWDGGDGLIISVPAQTRVEALQISNELMKAQLLPGHPLE
jgi:hypothetical protein